MTQETYTVIKVDYDPEYNTTHVKFDKPIPVPEAVDHDDVNDWLDSLFDLESIWADLQIEWVDEANVTLFYTHPDKWFTDEVQVGMKITV